MILKILNSIINVATIKTRLFNFILLSFLSLYTCKKNSEVTLSGKLFTSISSKETGVLFKNEIIENTDFYYYQYIYSYNGGGVASADFNNDGKQDLFFISNLGENKLYLNTGDFKFKDITANAGFNTNSGFNTGVSVVDINNDGLLDIYISRAGWFKDEKKCANLLYINEGDLTFKEQAEKFGLADTNRSMQTAFFDFDKDGDLDAYIVNAPYSNKRTEHVIDLKSIKNDSITRVLGGSDSFYENMGNGQFLEASKKVGIVPDIAFGLNAQIGDLNNDGWLDVYVNNDFNMPDFAYINNQDGTFSDKRETMFKHQPYYSMGSDVADINNDGLMDVISLDMSPEDYIRSKTTMSMTSINKFWNMVNNGYHYQYMHNMLQLNNGNGTFSEIANMSGIANTDWSWAPLLADFDLDGLNDIFITNGVFRDVIDKDTNTNILNIIRLKGTKPTATEFLKYTKMLPQQKLTNYFFKNNGNLTFSNSTNEWANIKPTFSNGAVYTDLDNDGDLDIVVNNINEEATILKNNAIESNTGHYLQLKFLGTKNNPFGLGVTVNLNTDNGKKQTRQLINTRGYLSSVTNTLHFGLGNEQLIKKIDVIWPDGKIQQLKNVKSNQLITVNYKEAIVDTFKISDSKSNSIFKKGIFNFTHKDSVFNDFKLQTLLPHKLSQLGPAIAKSDINNDGFDDLYLGGGYLQSGQILISTPSGGLKKHPISNFYKDAIYDDIGSLFFDIDNDGDQDLYVVSGSYEFYEGAKELQDRVYINNGNLDFKKCMDCLPEFYTAGSIVMPSDFDKDGDIDLFVGGRVIPSKYPYPPTSYLLENDKGKFKIITQEKASGLDKIGMVTDANWADIDMDGDEDLIITGEWMGIEIFENQQSKLIKSTLYNQLSNSKGWWNRLLVVDIDEDGDKDIIAGNLGLNYPQSASTTKPFHVYTNDFDYNGSVDIFLATYYKDKQVPVRGKTCASQQMPILNEKIKTYQEFANIDLQGILGTGIDNALHYQANEFRSGIFYNNGNGKFNFEPFENNVQKSPINGILYDDFDNDGQKDILLVGNNYHTEIETTRLDGGIGSFLKGNKKGEFQHIPNYINGFFVDSDTRNLTQVKTSTGNKILVLNNNKKHDLFSY